MPETPRQPRFVVQTFRAKGRGLEPDIPQAAEDEARALREVERAARGKAGAVALRQDGDPEAGDLDAPVVLRIVGRVPDAFLEDLPF